MDINSDKAMVMMVVTMAPMVAMMPSVPFYHDRFPVLLRVVVRGTECRVVLRQKRRKIQGSQ
jgi:hypothetical protein